MPDSRTEEQRGADEELARAIDRSLAAYRSPEIPTAIMRVDAMVVVAWTRFNDDGRQITGVAALYPDAEGTPHYRGVGMLDLMREQLVRDFYGGPPGT